MFIGNFNFQFAEGFCIAEFSVTEARSGLVIIQKQLDIEKNMREREREREREKERKRRIGLLKYWYVYLSALIEGLGQA